VLYIDVAKVDRDVAYIAMVVHICCNGLLLMFHLCVLDVCGKCVYLDVAYILHMLHVFYVDVTYVCKDFHCFQVFL
jgi:hypothetical protein